MKMYLVCLIGFIFSFANSQTIVIDFDSNIVIEGNNFEFNCTYSQAGSIVYSVNNNEVSGPIYERIQAEGSGASRQFTFQNAVREDNGTRFNCRVGPVEESVTLIVYYPANYTASTVEESALFCQTSLYQYFELIDGFPVSSFSWTKNNELLTPSSRVQLTATNISIPNLNVNDAGTYIVTSTNAAGNTTATLNLTVYCGPNLRVGDNTTTNRTIDEGGTFSIDCTVTQSIPAATIYLIINGGTPMDITSQPIQNITNISPNNAGTYICSAESGQAITRHTYVLTVNSTQVTPTTSIIEVSTIITPTTSSLQPTESGRSGLSNGAIAGIVVGVIVGVIAILIVIVVVIIIIFFMKKSA